jgi:hypothetical protein
VLLAGNSDVPVDLAERLGVPVSEHVADLRLVRRGGIVYVKAIELRRFGVTVGFREPATVSLVKASVAPTGAIMGPGSASVAQLECFLADRNPTGVQGFPSIFQVYIDEAAAEGVSHDVAFCQMCLETGFLRFGHDVSKEQNNFCGIGATGGGAAGASFSTLREGVQAHIQHLKAYASLAPLTQPKVDPRFDLVARGVAPNVRDLSGRWAADAHYGDKILSLMQSLREQPSPVPV